MNYRNYQTAIIRAWGVKLVGWPDGIPFTNPSHLGTVANLRRICDALRDNTCYWKALTITESEAHEAELQARAAAGKAIKVPRKKRLDFGRNAKPSRGKGLPLPTKSGLQSELGMLLRQRALNTCLTVMSNSP